MSKEALFKLRDILDERHAVKLLCACWAAYALVFFFICCIKYYGFVYDDFDLAIHDQIMWNVLHGRLFNSILGIDFLGNHVHFISFLLAPLYWLAPHPLFLLAAQTLFLAAGIFPLYALARLYLNYPTSLMVGVIYLLYPGLGYTNLYEFHPTCFATFFLSCTAYYFYKENFGMFNVFMFLSLICQENMPLVFLMWGIYAIFLKRDLRWTLWPSAVGLLYFLMCVYWILPVFNKNTLDFISIYGPLGNSLSQVAATCLLHPVKVAHILFQQYKVHYLLELFASVFFVPFLSPMALLPAFLLFLQHLLSSRPSEMSLHFHYTAELIPFIFVAFIFGIRRIIAWLPVFKYWVWVFVVNAFIFHFVLGPYIQVTKEWQLFISDYTNFQKENLIKEIPDDASVVATFQFLSHLSHHPDLYSFHYIYSNHYTLSAKTFHLPSEINYALVDFNDWRTFLGFYAPYRYRNLKDFMPAGPWGVLDVADNMVLFKKGIQDKYPLFRFINNNSRVPHQVSVLIDNRIQIAGYGVLTKKDGVVLSLYWKCLKPEHKDIQMFFDFNDGNGNLVARQVRSLCYRIWPTQAWRPGQMIEEYQYVYLPPLLKERLKSLKIGFYSFSLNKPIPMSSKDILGRLDVPLNKGLKNGQ